MTYCADAIEEETKAFSIEEAEAAALVWVNAQLRRGREEGYDYSPDREALVAGVPGDSSLCALTLSARMSAVGEIAACTRESARRRSENVEMPPVVRAFRDYFDAGAYPHLECGIADAVEFQFDDGQID
jgi:hypothetical protein